MGIFLGGIRLGKLAKLRPRWIHSPGRVLQPLYSNSPSSPQVARGINYTSALLTLPHSSRIAVIQPRWTNPYLTMRAPHYVQKEGLHSVPPGKEELGT